LLLYFLQAACARLSSFLGFFIGASGSDCTTRNEITEAL
jgi:hypothetical protein